MVSMKFDDVKKMWARIYVGVLPDYEPEDEDDDVIFCPECGEPLLRVDWPEFIVDDTVDIKDGVHVFCPICEMSL